MEDHRRHASNNTDEADRLDEENGHGKGFKDVREMKPHQSVGFWHHSLSKVRKHVIVLWCRTGRLISDALLGLSALPFWPSEFCRRVDVPSQS